MNDFPATTPPRPRFLRRAAGGVAGALLLAGCGSTAQRPIRPEFDLHDPSATRREKAVGAVEATRDTTQVSALITLLDDDDPAVRLAAGEALKNLTGHDTGYRASAAPEDRRRQVEAWRVWWAAHRGAATRTPGKPLPGGGSRAP